MSNYNIIVVNNNNIITYKVIFCRVMLAVNNAITIDNNAQNYNFFFMISLVAALIKTIDFTIEHLTLHGDNRGNIQ